MGHYKHESQNEVDLAIIKNLSRRPVTIKQIKNTYNPMYTYSLGKCRVDPKKKSFFRNKEFFNQKHFFKVRAPDKVSIPSSSSATSLFSYPTPSQLLRPQSAYLASQMPSQILQ